MFATPLIKLNSDLNFLFGLNTLLDQTKKEKKSICSFLLVLLSTFKFLSKLVLLNNERDFSIKYNLSYVDKLFSIKDIIIYHSKSKILDITLDNQCENNLINFSSEYIDDIKIEKGLIVNTLTVVFKNDHSISFNCWSGSKLKNDILDARELNK